MPLQSYRQIIVHCGMHKTGSSFIQKFLNDNAPKLGGRGIHFPVYQDSGNHSLLMRTLDKKKSVSANLAERIQLASPCETLLLSAEAASFPTVANTLFPRIRQEAPNARVVALLYLRRQDTLRESIYSEVVKRQHVGSIENVLYNFDLHERVKHFVDLVGRDNVIVRPYNPKQWPGGALGHDFLNAIGVGDLWEGISTTTADRVNESLSRMQIYLLSNAQTVSEKFMLTEAMNLFEPPEEKGKFFASPMQRKAFYESFAEQNGRLADLMGLQSIDEFFGVSDSDWSAPWKPFEPDPEALARYIVRLSRPALPVALRQRTAQRARLMQTQFPKLASRAQMQSKAKKLHAQPDPLLIMPAPVAGR